MARGVDATGASATGALGVGCGAGEGVMVAGGEGTGAVVGWEPGGGILSVGTGAGVALGGVVLGGVPTGAAGVCSTAARGGGPPACAGGLPREFGLDDGAAEACSTGAAAVSMGAADEVGTSWGTSCASAVPAAKSTAENAMSDIAK